MINRACMPLYMWEMWDVTPVTHEHTDGRTVESRAVFSWSWIRNNVSFHLQALTSSLFLFLLIWRIFGTPEACGRLIEFVSWEDVSPQLSDDLILLLESLEACTFQTRIQTNWSNAQILVTRHIWQNLFHKIRCSRVSPSIKGKRVKIFFLS